MIFHDDSIVYQLVRRQKTELRVMPDNDQIEASYTDRQLRVIAEIQRVARLLNISRLSKREFDKHHELGGLSTAGYQFGSWNRAVRAAGLEPNPQGMGSEPVITDIELLEEIIRLHRHLGKRPSDREMGRFGKFSPKPYNDRWGTFVRAREAAYERFGMPGQNEAHLA